MSEKAWAIRAEELSRSFGSFAAVRRLSFGVERGTIFGLLGANGAGKSTTIRMLCGLLPPSAGRAEVAGFDADRQSELVKRRIGYMSQKFSLYDDLTVMENIRFYGGVYGLDARSLAGRAALTVGLAGLAGFEDRLTGPLPGGFKQRLALGCALLHRPEVLFLDEPTAGVDPLSRRRFWRLIAEQAASGTTVLVTTHYLDEAEYCNNIVIMHAGAKLVEGSPRELKAALQTPPGSPAPGMEDVFIQATLAAQAVGDRSGE
jgi:ABC-2 type transport system ATP-binding protein